MVTAELLLAPCKASCDSLQLGASNHLDNLAMSFHGGELICLRRDAERRLEIRPSDVNCGVSDNLR